MTLSSLISRVEEGSELASASVRPELIERIESGRGADRDIDCVVAALADIQVEGVQHSWRSLLNEFGLDWAVDVATRHTSVWRTEVPRYTTSLDAVVSLIEQKLPGWSWDVGKVPPFALASDDPEWTGSLMGNEREVTYGHGEPPEMAFDTYNGHASSGARALLAACLRALSALENSKASLADATPLPLPPDPKATP